MKALRRMFMRVLGALTAGRREARLREEVEEHLALLTEEKIRAGMTPEEARRAAVLKFGPVESIKEEYREQRGLPWAETLWQDVRYAARTLRRDAGFTMVAVAIIAIGIGANTAIFSVLNTLVLRPLPFFAADRLVWIENDFPNNRQHGLSGITSRVDIYWEWQRLNQSFEQLEAYNAFFNRGSYSLAGDGEPERVVGVEVSRNLFPMLGVVPRLGRQFSEEESRLGGPRAALISHALWERRFSSDPAAVGRTVSLNDQAVTIVGVMPREFDFGSVFSPGTRVDLFTPLLLDEVKNWGNTLAVLGRLKPGLRIEAAQSEFQALHGPIAEKYPQMSKWFGARLEPLHDSVSGRLQMALMLLAGAVGAVLLIVCVNMGNLLLVRGEARRKEIAVRTAIGASRWRIARQLMTESLLLAAGGAIIGLMLAVAATRGLARLQGVNLPLLREVGVDGAVLTFTVLVTIASGLLFGLAPALAVSQADVHESLKEAARGMSEGLRRARVRSVLVVSQVALACVLVAAAGLLIRSFMRVLDVDLGFRAEHLAALRVDPSTRYESSEKRVALIEELVRRVRTVPGIETVSVTDALPLDRNRSWTLGAKGQEYPNGRPGAFVRFVMPGYFQAMGIPLRAGRDFSESDRKDSPAIILNETGARTLWPGESAIGRIASIRGRDEFHVVGVVGDVRHSGPEEQAGVEMYLPLLAGGDGTQSVDLVMRTKLDPQALASSVRTVLRPVDANLPVAEFKQLESLVDRAVSPRRTIVWLLGAFAMIALMLACVGIYGVVSYTVSRRAQEFGIRMALGASGRDVRLDVFRRTLWLAVAGVALGTAAGLLVTGFMGSLLYGVQARDPLTFAAAPAVLVAVALLAGYLPARRAARIDPISALRME